MTLFENLEMRDRRAVIIRNHWHDDWFHLSAYLRPDWAVPGSGRGYGSVHEAMEAATALGWTVVDPDESWEGFRWGKRVATLPPRKDTADASS